MMHREAISVILYGNYLSGTATVRHEASRTPAVMFAISPTTVVHPIVISADTWDTYRTWAPPTVTGSPNNAAL